MKIAFLTRSLSHGGAERQLATLAQGLSRRGHHVLVIPFYAGGAFEQELTNAGVAVRPINKRSRWDIPGFLFRLISLMRKERPDVIHGYLCVPNLLTVVLSRLMPRARIVWGIRDSNLDLRHYDLMTRFTYKIQSLASRFAHAIIVNSHAGMIWAVQNGFPVDKMVVIPNGIDTDRFRPDPAARLRVRGEWGIGETEQLIGRVGRLDPMKDYVTFIKAARCLAMKDDALRFVCVGSGPDKYRRELLEMSKDLVSSGKLIWAGPRDDMPAVYNAMDVIVSSSAFGEGFPNVVGEAMACGVSCVATDVGDSAFVAGDHGQIVPPREPEALKDAVERCLRMPNAIVDGSRSCRRRIIEEFSTGNLEARTEAVLLKLSENGHIGSVEIPCAFENSHRAPLADCTPADLQDRYESTVASTRS